MLLFEERPRYGNSTVVNRTLGTQWAAPQADKRTVVILRIRDKKPFLWADGVVNHGQDERDRNTRKLGLSGDAVEQAESCPIAHAPARSRANTSMMVLTTCRV